MKRVTGGDELTANFLYRETFRFHAQFKLWMPTNHRPRIVGQDLGIWRRIRLLPFRVTVPPEKQDKDLARKLRDEAPGILAWIVRGAVDWAENGLQAPESVLAATSEWKRESNDVATFVEERCHVADYAKCKSDHLYRAFHDWARGQGSEVIAKREFGKALGRLGFEPGRTNAEGRVWRGLGLLQEDHDA